MVVFAGPFTESAAAWDETDQVVVKVVSIYVRLLCHVLKNQDFNKKYFMKQIYI